MTLPLHRPILGEEEIAAVAEVLRSGFLVQGPRVAAFEARLAEALGLAHAVAVSSGTAALHLALRALGCGPGDEVVVPAFGFPATANAVELCGARAVPADVDPETFAVTDATVRAAAGPRTAGVVPVHPFGIPAPMAALDALAAEAGWWICEDAACALGTATGGRWAGGAWPVCLSFHPRKTITTGEGGLVATDDPALARAVRTLRNHGMTDGPVEGWRRFEAAGFNYRMTDVAAAIGLVQLDRLEGIVADRRRVAGWYRERLADVPEVRWPRGYDEPDLSLQSLVVELDGAVDRDALLAALAGEGIQATLGGYAMVEQPYYEARYGAEATACPVARRLARQAVTLPLSADMEARDVDRVAGALARLAGPGGAARRQR